MQSYDQCVERGVVARGGRDVGEFLDLLQCERVSGSGKWLWSLHGGRGVVEWVDESVAFGVLVDASDGGDEVGYRGASFA